MEHIEGKLVKSIEAKELGALTADYAELGLDALLEDGILKDIPIVGTLVSFAKVGLNIRDRLYVKKLIGFLAKVAETTQEQRDEFVKNNCQDGKKFEETVFLILDNADRLEKARLIGKIFKACVLGHIRYADALKLSDMVNRSYWNDLVLLINDKKIDIDNVNQGLLYAGFYTLRIDKLSPQTVQTSTDFTFSSSKSPSFEEMFGILRDNLKCKINDYGTMLQKIASM